jgi:hypothetical protein
MQIAKKHIVELNKTERERNTMSHSRIIRVDNKDYAVVFRACAWQECDTLNTVDGTVKMEAHSLRYPERTIVGLIHGELSRTIPNRPFAVTFRLDQLRQVIEYALSEWEEPSGSSDAHQLIPYRIHDARWRMEDCPVPHTAAPRYPGGAYDILERELRLGSESWMQDWPLEVSDPSRVDEFCAFYDQMTDPIVKFDTMQLALFSYDYYSERDTVHSGWFDRTLRRDFVLHGHTVAYWAALERASDDPELSLSNPEFVFKNSGLLRRIWEDSLIPIDLHWHLSE